MADSRRGRSSRTTKGLSDDDIVLQLNDSELSGLDSEEESFPDLTIDVQGEDPDSSSSGSDDGEPYPINIHTQNSRRQFWRHSDVFEPLPAAPQFECEPIVYFSKPPIDYLIKYVDDSLFEAISNHTNQEYLKKTGKILNSTKQEIKTFFGVSIIMSYLKYPRIRMFWSRQTRVDLIASAITRDRYFTLRSNLKVVEDELVPLDVRNKDKLWKVRPFLERIRQGCLQNPRSESVACDEQMIPFWGHSSMRQYIRGKPNPCGLKNFVAAAPDGLPLDFFVYEGKGDTIIDDEELGLNIGGKVIVRLAESLPEGVHIFMDRYFTSVPLLDVLHQKGLQGSGTIKNSNIPQAVKFNDDASMKRSGRGSIDQVVRNDGQISLVKWFDNKPVILSSSYIGKEPVDTCKRWFKKEREYRQVNRPHVVKDYNFKMGGIDLLDRIISYYRIQAKTRKWTIRVIFHFLDFAIAAAWVEYRRAEKYLQTPKKEQLDYLEFRERIANAFLFPKDKANIPESSSSSEEDDETTNAVNRKKRRLPVPQPPDELRKMSALHLPEIPCQDNTSRCRMPGCKSTKARVRCTVCKVFLCLVKERNCFLDYHKMDSI